MPPEPPFSRSNREAGPEDPAEGVRIIGADEAAEAVERGEAVRRKRGDKPRFGDRPEAPPQDVEPKLRFPLAGSADAASLDRPRAAPVPPRASGLFDRPEERPEPGLPDAEDLDLFVPVTREDIEGPLPEDGPVLTVEPASGESEMPHWTEPATGEVPRVILADIEGEADLAEQERWSSFGAASPRWRDEHDDWADGTMSELASEVEEHDPAPLGALDTRDRPTQDEMLSFEDLDVPTAPPMRAQRNSGAAAGSAGDPIRIGGQPNRPETPGRQGPGGRPPGDEPPSGRTAGRDVPTAVLVGVGIAAVAVILFSIGPAATMVLVQLVVIACAVELFGALRRGGHRPATLLGLVAVAALPLAAYWRGEGAIPLVLVLALVFSMLWYIAGIGGSAKASSNIGVTLFAVLYVGLLGAFGALILGIPAEGVSILLVAVVAGVFYDVGGFFVGRQIGRTRFTWVSPNKTVEGLVGGVGVSLVATFLVAVVLGFGPFTFGSWVVFGLGCAVAAVLGDLAESLLKRDLGLKDMGSILPGHGGVLDRFDGLLFVLPTAYYLVRSLDLVPGF